MPCGQKLKKKKNSSLQSGMSKTLSNAVGTTFVVKILNGQQLLQRNL